MLYKFNINHTCENIHCAENIHSVIETYLGSKINLNGHISISHVPKKHKVWLFLYDKKGKHESESVGKIIIKDSKITKEWTGKTPIISELEELFHHG
jgi:hypothetical protein